MRGERSAAGRFRQNVIRTAAEVCETSAWAACDLVPSADDTRALARRRSTQTSLRSLRKLDCLRRFLFPDRFRMCRRHAGFRLTFVPAMAASYGGLSVVGAGRSTGASRDDVRGHRRRRTNGIIG